MTTTENWSFDKFTIAMKSFEEIFRPSYMDKMEIRPLRYSYWSDTIYTTVYIKLNDEGKKLFDTKNMDETAKDISLYNISEYITKKTMGYLNTKVMVERFEGDLKFTEFN